MQALVTGGAGFIGGHIAEQLVRDGHEVTVLDNLDPFYDPSIKRRTVELARETATETDGRYRFYEGDVRNPDLVEQLVADVDYIFHQAGQAGVRQSVHEPRKYDTVNVDGTLNLLDACRDEDVERFVLASSSSVYGGGESVPYDEAQSATPVSPYGASKLAAERYACAYGEVYDISVVALRYFTVYGPRMRPNMAISNFVSRCFADEPPVVYGDGTQVRDFTYIDDVVDANLELLENGGADGEAINVGSTDTIEIRTLAAEVRDELAPDLDVQYESRHDADADRTHADTSKANALLGYEPTYSIREGLGAFIDWYRENRDWYEPLVVGS